MFSRNPKRTTLPGFTLIELAVVITIIGLLSYFGMGFLKNQSKLGAEEITDRRKEQIFHALAGYALRNGGLPKPSSPDTGEEVEGGKGVLRGLVPTAKLGLVPETAKDGFGYFFTYAVDSASLPDAKIRTLAAPFCHLTKSTEFSLNVVNFKGASLVEEEQKTAVVLISHGPGGRGAYLSNGTQRACEDEHESTNASESETFVYGETHNTFQHKVYWVTVDSLMAAYAHVPCGKNIDAKQKAVDTLAHEDSGFLNDEYTDPEISDTEYSDDEYPYEQDDDDYDDDDYDD